MARLYNLLALCCLILVTYTQESQGFITNAKSLRNSRSDETFDSSTVPHSFVTLGASGDLAKRKIYPALWYLFRDNLLPPKTRFYGYSLSQMTIAELRKNCDPFIKVHPSEKELYEEFWSLNRYINGTNDSDADYNEINDELNDFEQNGNGNRIFYLALPPSIFPSAASQVKRACMAPKGKTRLVIEKPFGRDSATSEKLSNHLSALFEEDQIYRMDHFLGKEMIQNLLTFRFANKVFEPSWNNNSIASVEVLFEENLGVEGRGGYFDQYGIIRDVMQNHLLQIVSLIAMEKPVSGHTNDIRDKKVNLLKDIKSIVLDDVVLGQYVGNPDSKNPKEQKGYLEDPSVPSDSLTATFALTVLRINNDRWSGVPFIIRAGKGLGKKKTEIRIQYRDVIDNIHSGQVRRNELILRVAKGEAIEMKIASKSPGITSNVEQIKVNFIYENEYKHLSIPEAYERLILDVFRGSQVNFVRTDELKEAWRIFTPILHKIEDDQIRPINYKFGTRGPEEADDMEKKNNYF